MQVVDTEISKIVPYENNPRAHSEEQINRIASSIAEFGFNQPIVVDENNIVLVGHGRLEAAKKIGRAQVPIIRLSNLTEAQKKAYRIIDNKLQNDSTWQIEDLNLELSTLDELGFDLDLYGLNDLKIEVEPEVTDDDFEPSETIQTNIKLGDLIELGAHRVLCGDSTKADDLGRLMGETVADLLITDPPYGVNHIGGTKDPRRSTHRTGGVVTNDDLGTEGTRELLGQALENLAAKTRAGCVAYIASPAGTLLPYFIEAMAKTFEFRHSLVWVKHAFVFGRADYHYRHELILYGWKSDGAHYFCGDRRQDTVLEFDRGDKMVAHPTSKPIPLFGKLIANSSKQNGKIVDPFLGSGTTLIACEQLGRICYGMEIEPKYCQVIVDRYRNYCLANNKEPVIKINGVSV